MGEVQGNRWDTPTGRAAWLLLVAFTALSSYLNYRSANLDGSHEIAHAAVPFVVLVVGGFVELALLSAIHRVAKAATVTALFACFAVVLVTSYLGILPIAKSWFHAMPERVVFGLAAIPDVVMLAAVSVLMSLRARRKGTASETAQPSRWARISGNLGDRIEQMTAAPPSANPSAEGLKTPTETPVSGVTEPLTDPSVEALETPSVSSVEPSAEEFVEPLKTPAKVSAKPSPRALETVEEPLSEELLAVMDEAREMDEAELIRGKNAIDYARIIAALDDGWSPTRIKKAHGYSHTTTDKVADFRAARRDLTPVG